jgi:hypothetical protein
MGDKSVDPKLQEWIQNILLVAKQRDIQQADHYDPIPIDEKTPMDVHRDLLHLEADFQV